MNKTKTKRFSAVFSAVLLSLTALCGCAGQQPAPESSAGSVTTLSAPASTAASATETTAQTAQTAQTADTSDSDSAPADAGSSTAGSKTTGQAGTHTPGTKHTKGGGTAARSETLTTAASQPKSPEELLSGMTLEQKAAQMMLVGITNANTAKEAAKDGIGALCMFAKPYQNKTADQVRAMHAGIQKNAAIPMIISADEEGGTINRVSLNKNLRSSPFPSGRDLFTAGGWDAVIKDTREKASLLKKLGLNVNLAPVCDVPLDRSNYIYDRCFSLDAEETAEYIRKVVTEMKKNSFGSVLKHFPGYGGSVDTHKQTGYDSRDYSAFETGDFLPFIAGIQAGADAVMVSHNIVRCMDDKNPASLSPAVHQILRSTLGFDGVIISDDLGMNAITLFTGGKNPAVAAVQAGNDLVAFADYKTSVAAIVKAVRDGQIPQSQIDASVLRILRWKRSLGLL